jgi:hypothetical protein
MLLILMVYHFLLVGVTRPRRKARKIICDLRFMMNVIEQRVWLNDRWTDEHTLESANEMFQSAANLFVLEDNAARHIRRSEHLKWQTFVPRFCRIHPQYLVKVFSTCLCYYGTMVIAVEC